MDGPHLAPAAATTDSPLLRLPPHVRRLVYLRLGVASLSGRRPYTFDLHGCRACRAAPPPGSLSGLSLCCRTIYIEAAALIYSVNHFIIHCWTPGSLAPLLALTALPLRSLTSLKVIPNQASCHDRRDYDTTGYCCREDDEEDSESIRSRFHNDDNAHQAPLFSQDPNRHDDPLEAARVMFREWDSAAVHLGSSLPNSQLPESVYYHCSRTATFGFATNPQLQQVAHDAVMGARRIATPYSSPPLTLRLMQISRELDLYILEHTDLVTPWMEVSWGRHEGRYSIQFTGCAELSGFEARPAIHHGCQFNDCLLRHRHPGVPLITAIDDDSQPEAHQVHMTDAQGSDVGRGEDGGGGGGGLARFYAELVCPWFWTPATKARLEQDGLDFHYGRDRARKEAAERAVMGARYESLYAGGRRQPRKKHLARSVAIK
ncbi:hypothetical protein C8A05DRAFT_34014 [Staphylotrichum tortipilum]|uniref:Uncharacterized protein n=1 Tax=Staphylotrichum tortipilum TaxID=2831512 RepID=A0AAN6MJX9_9PEZI|nr:hypothetical protein C8A05DRAFT_34014 [Staphylotrichum longicolle]